MAKRTIALALVAVLPLMGIPAVQAAPSGKQIYHLRCATCHGEKGKGDGPAAAALEPKPRDFTSGHFKYGKTLPAIERTIHKGVPDTAMTPFEGILTDAEIAAVAKYVYSLARGGGN